MTSDLGKLIGDRYELTELAGQGGMATVWRATMHGAAGFTRQVAVKKIRPEFRAIRNYIDMFVEEARVGSDLNHPNIVQIHDFLIDPEGSYYLVMEWVEGMDLGSFVRAFNVAGVPVPWMLIAAAGVGALRGLGAAHERRKPDGRIVPVIHRDVSPHNILVGVNGVVKLTDFGLARARDRVYSLTAPGTVKGKLTYLPPEVTHGQPATAQSDIFALGNVLWETLAGRPLFRGSSDLEVFRLIRDCIVPPISSLRADVPAPLAEIIHCALAREPAERFPTARAMAKALAEVLRATRWQDDAQATLGAFVTRARSQQGIQESEVAGAVAESEHLDTWAFMSSPRSEGLAGSIHDIQGAAVEFTSARPPAAATPGSVGGAEGSSVGSIDIEFTDAAIPVPPPKDKT